jgi:shikimate 5-dehydrogenase
VADVRRIAILGAGRIGESLLAGLLSSGWRTPDEIVVTARREERAAELAERYAREEVRGEVVLVIGAASAQAAALESGVAALRRLVDAGARARPAAGVVAELTGLSANALYRALTATEEPRLRADP